MAVTDVVPDQLTERVTLKHALIVSMILVSLFMLVESRSFQREAYLFPRFAAVITIVGSSLLLLQNYLPERLQRAVSDSVDLFGGSERKLDEEIGTTEDETQLEAEPEADQAAPTQFMALLLLGFAVLSYLVGMLWTIPVFIAVYSHRFDISRRRTVLLAVVGFLIGLAFQVVLGIPIDRGVLLTAGSGLW